MNQPTQNAEILCHLQKGMKLTPLQALKLYGCYRLSARILELREAGYPIRTEPHPVKSRSGKIATVAKYSL